MNSPIVNSPLGYSPDRGGPFSLYPNFLNINKKLTKKNCNLSMRVGTFAFWQKKLMKYGILLMKFCKLKKYKHLKGQLGLFYGLVFVK